MQDPSHISLESPGPVYENDATACDDGSSGEKCCTIACVASSAASFLSTFGESTGCGVGCSKNGSVGDIFQEKCENVCFALQNQRSVIEAGWFMRGYERKELFDTRCVDDHSNPSVSMLLASAGIYFGSHRYWPSVKTGVKRKLPSAFSKITLPGVPGVNVVKNSFRNFTSSSSIMAVPFRSISRQAAAAVPMAMFIYVWGLASTRGLIKTVVTDDRTELSKEVQKLYQARAPADFERIRKGVVHEDSVDSTLC